MPSCRCCPTYRYLRGDPRKQAQALVELAEIRKEADSGDLVLLSQDEARFPMVPTLGVTLGVKGFRRWPIPATAKTFPTFTPA